jgi:hypothetical protein
VKGPVLFAVILVVLGVGLVYIGWTGQAAALKKAATG